MVPIPITQSARRNVSLSSEITANVNGLSVWRITMHAIIVRTKALDIHAPAPRDTAERLAGSLSWGQRRSVVFQVAKVTEIKLSKPQW